MPYRCRDCRQHFSVRKGTVMESSKIGLQKWVIAIYMMTTGIKGTSSMKLHRELGVTQATAWFMMQRIREAFIEGDGKPLHGPVEADESYFGGKEKNKHADKRLHVGGGTGGKTAVVGVVDRDTNHVEVRVTEETTGPVLRGFVESLVAEGAEIFTDEAAVYNRLPNHQSVRHSVGEYVKGKVHTNGIESFWALLKRGYHGTFHQISPKHLDRYVKEFAGRHNIRSLDTLKQMVWLANHMVGKRLKYRDIIA